MMKGAVSVLIGALLYFFWGMVSWMILPWHDATIKKVPEEKLVMDTLGVVVKESGFYYFPHDHHAEDYKEQVKKGPVGLMVIHPQGKAPMGGKNYFFGFLVALMVSLGSCLVLYLSRQTLTTYLSRLLTVSFLGALVWGVAHLPYWNWFGFPFDYTMVMLGDLLIGFTLVGSVLARCR